MATLVSATTGNWTSSSTWNLVSNSGGGTTNNTNTTTSYVYGVAFTITNATVVIGMLLLARRNNTTGTVNVALSDDNGTTATREVQINASELVSSAGSDWGWVYFKFGSSLTADGGSDYRVGVKSSSSGSANFLRSATAGDWQYFIVTNTTQAPAAGDVTFTMGARTAPATLASVTVTMNETAATEYSTTVIGDGGTMTWDTTQDTLLRVGSGSSGFQVDNNGIVNIGSSGTPIPRARTATLEFVTASDGATGLRVKPGGTLNCYGESRSSGKDIVRCRLANDVSAADTLLLVDTDTGWKNGDEIAIASTTQTPTQHEQRTLSTDAGASSLTISSGLTNDHFGLAPLQADVILLTRNVKIRSTSSSNMSFIRVQDLGVVNAQWLDVRYCGTNAIGTSNCGFRLETTSTCTFRYCVVRDGEAFGWATTAAMSGFSVQDSAVYNCCTGSGNAGFYLETTTTANYTLRNIVVMGNRTLANYGFRCRNISSSCTFENLTVTSCNGSTGTALWLEGSGNSITVDGFNFYSNTFTSGAFGLFTALRTDYTIKNGNIWHNSSTGTNFDTDAFINIYWENVKWYGNGTAALYTTPEPTLIRFHFKNCLFAGTTSYAQPRAVWMDITTATASSMLDWLFESCSFGVVSGVYVGHSVADFVWDPGISYATIRCVNCSFGSSTILSGMTIADGMARGSFFSSQQHNETVAARVYTPTGTLMRDQDVALVPPSLKMTPSHATFKLDSAGSLYGKGFLAPIGSGSTVTVRVAVRKDSSYNGNAPRLLVKTNPAIGITAETVLDTFSVGANTWEILTGTTAAATATGVVEFVVDCDGTAGNVYVDSWGIS